MNGTILSELARAKVLFQLRAVEAIIHGPASAIEAGTGETTQIGPTEGESAVAKPDAQAQEQNPCPPLRP